MIKAIVFDLDDTLYEEITYVYQGFYSVAQHLGKRYHIEAQVLFGDMCKILENKGRGKIFNHICEKYGFMENIKELVDVYQKTRPDIKLYKDAEVFLKQLKLRGIKTGLITDGASLVQHRKIEALGIDSIIDSIIVTDDKGREYWKPNKAPFDDMLKNLGCSSDDAIYIGDNPYKDFIGAKEVGMKTIRVQRKSGMFSDVVLDNQQEADRTIHTLLEMEELLQ